ncbi:hypothetical protein [Hymenobacter sp. YC55]|uniref:hypothetical protein n=1 Tax=Hymenobacter sp. YC55 TaxID=3034019 RepID=UPI0023F7DF4B|nr:hypothetical protein [Hymenobacter sp. YC55]MDF7815418.1 hypothetical protein [Hymenobacter sp. YC55]
MHPRDLERLRYLLHIALLHKPLTRDKIKVLLQEHFQRQLPTDYQFILIQIYVRLGEVQTVEQIPVERPF